MNARKERLELNEGMQEKRKGMGMWEERRGLTDELLHVFLLKGIFRSCCCRGVTDIYSFLNVH